MNAIHIQGAGHEHINECLVDRSASIFVRSVLHFQQFSSFVFNLIKILTLHETPCFFFNTLTCPRTKKKTVDMFMWEAKKTKIELN